MTLDLVGMLKRLRAEGWTVAVPCLAAKCAKTCATAQRGAAANCATSCAPTAKIGEKCGRSAWPTVCAVGAVGSEPTRDL